MPKKSAKKPKPFPVEDVPTNPEFKAFADFTRRLMDVPKEEIDRRVKEEAEKRKGSR